MKGKAFVKFLLCLGLKKFCRLNIFKFTSNEAPHKFAYDNLPIS